jgi:hypothetical protein
MRKERQIRSIAKWCVRLLRQPSKYSNMRSVTFILGCYLVLILRKSKWNKLTGYPKDNGKNWPNSSSNSLQPGQNDANCLSNSRRPSGWLLIPSRPVALHFMFKDRGCRDGHKSRPDKRRMVKPTLLFI